MSALLVLLFLTGAAAIVWSVCFVGCSFAPQATAIDGFYQYQQTVGNTPGLVTCWPLDETAGTVAFAFLTQFNGTYTTGPDVPTYNAAQQSDASPGTFTLGQPNIVAGDTGLTGNPDQLAPCPYFNGGFVRVPWQAALGPSQFTLEAWVVPDWTLADAQTNPSFRVIVSTSGASAASTGFILFASPDNLWAAAVGIGTQFVTATTSSNQTIVQGSLYFLVVTYDGTTLTLWVNPADTTQPPDASAAATGYVPVASPVPLLIGTGGPALPTPLFPHRGRIQDVALYDVVLDNNTIETHYLNGSGMQIS